MNLTLVSYHYPPSRIANARRPALLARELAKRGCAVRVLTRSDDATPAAVAGPSGFGTAGVDRLPDPVAWWRRRWGRNRVVRSLLCRMWPDDALPWTLAAARRLKTTAPAGPVLACIHPVSSLLLSRWLPAGGGGMVFDYQESVTPFRRQVPYEYLPHRRMVGWLARLERSALRRADGAVFTSDVNREAYVGEGLIDPSRSRYIPHACDPNPHAGARLSCGERLVISHVGYFNQDRSPEVFLRGLAAFLKRRPEAANRVRVDLYGNGLGPHRGLCADLGLVPVVCECGETDYEVCLGAIANSHLLLLVAAPCHRLFFPSKLPEYIAARRPVLALLPVDSDARPILRASGRDARVCTHDAPDQVTECLETAWAAYVAGDLGAPLADYAGVLFERSVDAWMEALSAFSRSDGHRK